MGAVVIKKGSHHEAHKFPIDDGTLARVAKVLGIDHLPDAESIHIYRGHPTPPSGGQAPSPPGGGRPPPQRRRSRSGGGGQ
jgi:hypothetical protein